MNFRIENLFGSDGLNIDSYCAYNSTEMLKKIQTNAKIHFISFLYKD